MKQWESKVNKNFGEVEPANAHIYHVEHGIWKVSDVETRRTKDIARPPDMTLDSCTDGENCDDIWIPLTWALNSDSLGLETIETTGRRGGGSARQFMIVSIPPHAEQ